MEDNNKEKIMTYLDTSRPKQISVHYGQTARFAKAEEQAALAPVPVNFVITYVNEYLKLCGISCEFENCIKTQEISPEEINNTAQKMYALNHPQDLIWMKFTEDGYLGVVAMSNDLSFDIPPSREEYDERKHGRWKYSTSGIIVDYLQKKWDTSFVLVFPLPGLQDKSERHLIEIGIGNYLISKGVPILDFYSHRI